MFFRRLIRECLLAFILCFTSAVFAQSARLPEPLENPAILPQNRQPITVQNSAGIRLLAAWGLGTLSDIGWVDNDLLAVTSNSGTWLYDVNRPNQPVLSIPDAVSWDRSPVPNEVKVSPDGQWMALNSKGAVWYIPTGKNIPLEVPLERGIIYPIEIMAWLPDSRLLTVVRNTITFWRLSATEAEIDSSISVPRTQRTAYNIEQLAISPDSKSFALVARALISDQILVQFWDIEHGTYQTFYEDPLIPETNLFIQDIQFNQDGSEVALALSYPVKPPDGYRYTQHEIWRWESASGDRLASYIPDCNLTKFNYAADSGFCQSTEYNPSRTLTEIHRLSDWVTIAGPLLGSAWPTDDTISGTNYYTVISISQQQPATGSTISYSYSAEVWDETGERIAVLDFGSRQAKQFVISPDANRIAVMFESYVQVFDIHVPEQSLTLETGNLVNGFKLALSPDNRYLVVVGSMNGYASGRSQVMRWKLETSEYEIIPNQESATSAAYSPDGKLLVIGRSDGNLYVYDAETLTRQAVLFNDGRISDMAFSHDGRLLAVVNDRYIRLWDLPNQQIVNRVAYSQTRSLVFTAADDWLIYGASVWKIENQGRLFALWDAEDATDEVRALLPTDGLWYQSYRSANNLLLIGRGSRFLEELLLMNIQRPTLSPVLWSARLWSERTEPESVALGSDLIAVLTNTGTVYLYGVVTEGE